MTVRRDGQTLTVTGTTFYDKANKKYRFGFAYDPDGTKDPAGPLRSTDLAATGMWNITTDTVSHIVQIFNPEKRKEVGSVVGGFETTRQAIEFKTSTALIVLAFISLSLGVINLFPFLPLDGGHIFWALAEKVRGRPIPFSVMERASVVGFMLVIALFVIGLSNDIGRLTGDGFNVR
jgi:regulator of sigma E protease